MGLAPNAARLSVRFFLRDTFGSFAQNLQKHAEEMEIDIPSATKKLEAEGCKIIQQDEMMAVFQWNSMETTLYCQGKIMFFPLEDKHLCIKYATEILESL